MEKQQYSLPEINWLLSFPTEEITKYWLEHDLLDSPGLLAHIVLGRILVFQLAKWLPKGTEFDIDTALSLTTVYHATRQSADYGKAGKHPNPEVNEYMKDHHDMDYALKKAKEHGLILSIIQGIKDYLINPSVRKWGGYFPHETLEGGGKIKWTEALPMLTSWLVAGVITHMDKRFHDLRTRRSAEIGKLELPYWQNQLRMKNPIQLPRPIMQIALKDKNFSFQSEQDIVEAIRDGVITDEIMGKWILDGYEEWANHVVEEYCKLAGIDDFYAFLKEWIDALGTDQLEKKEKINKSFQKMLGRPLADDEFIPYIDGIDLLWERIAGLKSELTREVFRGKVRRSMEQIERVIGSLDKKE